MASGTKPAAGKSTTPQRSIKSFFTSSPAKASEESSKKKELLVIGGALETPTKKPPIESTPEKRKKKEPLVTPTKATRGKRKVESSPKPPIAKKPKLDVEEEVKEEETPVKRRRLRKVKEEVGSEVIGRRLKVYWPLDKAWYAGKVTGWNASDETHSVLYDDGEEAEVDIAREKVEWLLEEAEAGRPPKRERSVEEEEEDGAPRRRRARRQIKCIVESDESGDDTEDEDFKEASEEHASEVDDAEEEEDGDDEVDEPEEEEESDSDVKASRKKPKKAAASAVKKPAAKKASKAAPKITMSSGIVKASSNDFASGDAAERFGGRDAEKFKFLGKDRKDAAGKKPTDPAYNPCTLHLPADFVKKLSEGQRQWWMFKAKHMDKVLLFKMGKFYEMFEMDAHIGVKELDLQYMKGEQPHCGFPEKTFSDYAHKLALKGYRVLVVEQTETPDQLEKRRRETGSKDKVVMREVCAVITRGTMVDGDVAHMSGERMVMLSIVEQISENDSPIIGLCVVDSSTGCFQLCQFEDDAARVRLSAVLTELRPVEVIKPRSTLSSATSRVLRDCTRNPLVNELSPGDMWDAERTFKEVSEVYSSLEDAVAEKELLPSVLRHVKGLGERGKMAMAAFGACVQYLRQAILDRTLLAVRRIELLPGFNAILDDPESKAPVEQAQAGVDAASYTWLDTKPYMVLDGAALENLEVLENSNGGTYGTLLATLDHCVTPFGRRLLREWLARPLLLKESIKQRQLAVKDLKGVALDAVSRFKKEMARVPDLERALARLHTSSGANGRNAKVVVYEDVGKKQVLQFTSALRGCRAMLQAASHFDSCLSELTSSHLRNLLTFGKGMPDLKSVIEHFETAFDWPEAENSGRIIPREGVDSDYDAASAVISEVEGQLDAYLKEQRAYFGEHKEIVYLTVGKEQYQMEVPERFLAKIPKDFEVRSSRKGFRRYWSPVITSLLKELAAGVENRESALKDILMHLMRDFCKHNATWLSAVKTIAEVDALVSISAASLYTEGPTCTPTFSNSKQQAPWFYAKDLRHPTAGAALTGGSSFVPNDVNLGGEQHAPFMLLTGPNMGGKSTLLRQVCLAVILAQVGADVPAGELQLAPVDQVFVRMGARDNIMAGQSTFLVELQETATMLRSATKNSLVALDELGRGTATSDGQAIAHAVLTELTHAIGCRGIFSTHYHRLATEHATDSTVALYHMGCKVASNKGGLEEVTFLYKLCPGACPKSYGVNVARLAGMPESILQRASTRSAELEITFDERSCEPVACKLLKELGQSLEKAESDSALERLKPLWVEVKELVAATA